MDAWTAILSALAVASGFTAGVLASAAILHQVGATRFPPPRAQSWADRVDPDLLLPPPIEPVTPPARLAIGVDHGRGSDRCETTLLLIHRDGRVDVVVPRVAPPRVATPKGVA